MLAKAFGQGSHSVMKQLAEHHTGLNAHCRYLGPQLHWSGNNGPEIKARRAQAWHAFKAFSRLWSSDAPKSFKINIFTASVQSVFTSAATTLVLSNKELGMMCTTHQQMLRVLLKGKACAKTRME